MTRCSWCNQIIWPWQKKSDGQTMHVHCGIYVDQITKESQAQYRPWTAEESYEQFLMRVDQEKDL